MSIFDIFGFKPKVKENWCLVKTFKELVEQHYSARAGVLYYHLLESNTGSRRVEFACSIPMSETVLEIQAKRLDLYQEKIYRWQMGRADPDIPRYDQVPEDDTVAVLRGTIDKV